MSHIYYPDQIRRLMDVVLPEGIISEHRNPVLDKLRQLPEFGWHNCTPQDLGQALMESFDAVNSFSLLEHAANAKRWIEEHIKAYILSKLPWIIRKIKIPIDVIKIIQFTARIVATVKFLISLIQKAIALANKFIDEGLALIAFAKTSLGPSGLRTQAEKQFDLILDRAVEDLNKQLGFNGQTTQCLI